MPEDVVHRFRGARLEIRAQHTERIGIFMHGADKSLRQLINWLSRSAAHVQ